MCYEVKDYELRRLIKRRAIKMGFNKNDDGCFVRYTGRLYYVDFQKDIVIEKIERK